MDIKEMKAKVDTFFKENPEFETTLSKEQWLTSESDVTYFTIKLIRRTFSKLEKSRKRKIKTSDLSKFIVESIDEIVEEW